MTTSVNPGGFLTLPDGNKLYYAVYGDINATATVFMQHGLPGSHLEARIYDAAARRNKTRIVGVDRPGMGRSTFHNYRLLEWPAKLLALADHLQAGQFAILGVSCGGPYALACLHQLPRTRCIGAAVVAGMYPPSFGFAGMNMQTRVLYNLAAWSPWLVEKTLEASLGTATRDAEHPEKCEEMLAKIFETRPPQDRAVWDENKSNMKPMLVDDLKEAFRNGSKGAAWEFHLLSNDWGFKLEDMDVEKGKLVLWHGGLDENCPPATAKKADELIPGAELRFTEDGGHVSVFANTVEESIDTLAKMLSS